MAGADDQKKIRRPNAFSRFTTYLRNVFGKSDNRTQRDRAYGSVEDITGGPSISNRERTRLPAAREESDAEQGNRQLGKALSTSVGNLIERTPPPSSSSFRNELAAKLNAGPGFPFGGGGIRRPAASPAVAADRSATVASGDATPASVSPGSPSAIRVGGEGAGSRPIQDAYMDGAMLRINLNRQRRHRARTNHPVGTGTSGALLDRISEEDGVRPTAAAAAVPAAVTSPQPPSTAPKPEAVATKRSSRSSYPEMMEVETSGRLRTPSKSSTSSSSISTSDDSEELEKLPYRVRKHLSTEGGSRSSSEGDLDEIDKEASAISLSKSLPRSGEFFREVSPSQCKLPRSSEHLLPSRRSQRSQREKASTSSSGEGSCGDSTDEEVGKLSAVSPCVATKASPPAVTPVSPPKPLGRPESMFAGSSASPPSAAFTGSRIPSIGSTSSKTPASRSPEPKSHPSVRQPPPTPPKPELAPPIKPEGVHPAVRLRPTRSQTTREPTKILVPSAEDESNRQSRVCDLIKVFQQSNAS